VTDDIAAMVEFLRAGYAEAITRAREFGNVFITNAEDRFGMSRSAAEDRARASLHAAEARARFFEETVVPYLGTAGPVGRIAEQQLRLLAWEHSSDPSYQQGWAP
jgi:hypothetical protein